MKGRIEELKRKIKFYNSRYYNDSISEISDKEYDLLFKELINLEKEYPQFKTKDSPSNGVGATVKSTFEKIKHKRPMLSLDNTYDIVDINKFIKRVTKGLTGRIEFIAEPKYDGVSISLLYEDNQLIQAITRGNGEIGEDITENIKTIKDIPHMLNHEPPLNIEVRGEIMLTNTMFELLNREKCHKNEPLYKNPRNTVSGTLRQHLVSTVRERNLCSKMYLLLADKSIPGVDTQEQALLFLNRLGFNTPRVNTDTKLFTTAKPLLKFLDVLESKRSSLEDLNIDGGVLKVNKLELWKKLGTTGRVPRYSIAFKFDTSKKETVLLDIYWQVGRTGRLTPVALLEPIFIDGSLVSRASLHNYNLIVEKDIRVGDTVVLEKAAEIIPNVISVVKDKRPKDSVITREPVNCPECGTPLIQKDGKVGHFCPNPNCLARLSTSILHFAGREGVNILSLGVAVISKLIAKGELKSIGDIYDIPKKYSKSKYAIMRTISQNIVDSKKNSPVGLLVGFGITGVGKRVGGRLMRNFESIDDILVASKVTLDKIVGDVVSDNIIEWRSLSTSKELIQKLRDEGVNFHRIVNQQTKDIFKGKSFVLTGKMSLYGSKDIVIKEIESCGGTIKSSVSKNTDYLVFGEDAGSKLTKAKELGVKIINELNLKEMIGR